MRRLFNPLDFLCADAFFVRHSLGELRSLPLLV
jgi:hypothetical protein